MANSETLQKIGLVGGLLFAAGTGALYFSATRQEASAPLKAVRAVPPPASAAAPMSAGAIPVGVLGMMRAPRVVPAASLPAVESTLDAALEALDACYDAQTTGDNPDGTLYVKLHTTEGGGVRDVQVAFRGPAGRALQACTAGVLATLDFGTVPPDTLVSWPLRWGRGKGLRLR